MDAKGRRRMTVRMSSCSVHPAFGADPLNPRCDLA